MVITWPAELLGGGATQQDDERRERSGDPSAPHAAALSAGAADPLRLCKAWSQYVELYCACKTTRIAA